MLKEIKKFYISNKIISNIGICALFIFVSYIITYNMPDIFGIEPLYNGLYNLAIGYIGSMIFYILQVYIPSKRKSDDSLRIISPDIHRLCEEMGFMIEFLRRFASISGGKITMNNMNNNYIFYKVRKTSGQKQHDIQSVMDVADEFESYKDKLESIIGSIKSKSVYQNSDEELITLISKLECNQFSSILGYIGKVLTLPNTHFGDLERDLNEFENIKDELQKFDTDKIIFEFECLTEDEIKDYFKDIEKYEAYKKLIDSMLDNK